MTAAEAASRATTDPQNVEDDADRVVPLQQQVGQVWCSRATSAAAARSPVTFSTVANVSGIASTAIRIPMPSAGSPIARARREHDERAARNARRGEREEHRGEGDGRELARVQRHAVEPADEERARPSTRPAPAILNVETASGSTKPVTAPAAPSPFSALSTSAGSEAIDELELKAMSCAGSAARANRRIGMPPSDGHDRIEQQRDDDAARASTRRCRSRSRRRARRRRARPAAARARRRRSARARIDPAHEHEHRVAQRAEEPEQRRARCSGSLRDGEREEQREEDQRHHRAVRRGGDRVGRDERREPRARTSGAWSAATSWLAASAAPAGSGGPRAARRQQREERRRRAARRRPPSPASSRTNDEQRPSAEPADRLDVGGRGDAGDEQRDDERDHRHADGVDPQRADRRDASRPRASS